MLWILLGIAILVILFIVVVSLQPSEFAITRTSTMAASQSKVFEQVNDFHNWAGWSPWEKIDPAMNKTYEGSPAGPGAIYAWKGNKKVGEGRMTILETRPSEWIRIKLEFFKPFKATNEAQFTFTPIENRTAVTWTMTGKKNFLFKAFGLLMSMDKLVGKDFEKGLAAMKSIVEAS